MRYKFQIEKKGSVGNLERANSQQEQKSYIIFILNVKMNQQQNQMQYQAMYNQLLGHYSSLASNYHLVAQQNFELFSKLENLMEEKISLMKEEVPTQAILPAPLPQFQEGPVSEPRKTSSEVKEISSRSRRSRNNRINKIYKCTYPNCTRIYRSSVSMNLHIKIKHNGGTKRQRQSIAKNLIDSEQKGEPLPQNPFNLPPNFLEEYRKTYEYSKKYNM